MMIHSAISRYCQSSEKRTDLARLSYEKLTGILDNLIELVFEPIGGRIRSIPALVLGAVGKHLFVVLNFD